MEQRERGELYAQYQAGIESRKNRLQAVKEHEDAALAAIRQQWEAKRQEIEAMGIAKRNRRNLLALARTHEAEAIAKAKLELSPEREAVRQAVPYTSWQEFLKLEAGNGNEVLFSAHDKTAGEVAMKYAAKKWVKHITLEQGRIKSDYASVPLEVEHSQKQQGLSR